MLDNKIEQATVIAGFIINDLQDNPDNICAIPVIDIRFADVNGLNLSCPVYVATRSYSWESIIAHILL